MKKKILLINPWIYDFAAYDFWMKPIGLLYIASILIKNGYEVHYIDCLNTYHPQLIGDSTIEMPKKRFSGHGKFPKEIIAKPTALKDVPKSYNRYGITPRIFIYDLKKCPKPDIILITSMMTYWYLGVKESIELVRATWPGVPIVLGGNYVTLCPDHASLLGADAAISGEGERHLPSLVKSFLNDDLIWLPDNHHLDSYPYPAFDLLPFQDQVPILTSRGCPFRCTYCASHLLYEGFRRRDPIKVVDEITFWNKQFGIRHFSFYDDAFLVNPDEMAIPMMKEILNRKLACEFHCPNGLHLREMTHDISRLMFDVGFKTIRFGFETSDVKRQKDTGGKVTNVEFEEAVNILKYAGYMQKDIGIYILCGLPGQEAVEVKESIAYVKSCGARPMITEYSPIPGTVLWDESRRSSPYDLEVEPLFHNNSIIPCQWEKLTYAMYQELKLTTRNA